MPPENIRQFIQEEIRRQTEGDIDTKNTSVAEVREIVREEVPRILAKSSVTVEGNLELKDSRNIIVGSTTGTQISTTTNQKIGFHGSSPVIQSASANQAVLSLDVDVTGTDTVDKAAINTNFTNIQTLVNQLRTDLINKGLIKGSA